MANQIKTVIVTKFNPHPLLAVDQDGNTRKFLYEFTMYRTLLLRDVKPLQIGQEITKKGYAEMMVYGLAARTVWYEGSKRMAGPEVDYMPISARQYEVNAILQKLCSMEPKRKDIKTTARGNNLIPLPGQSVANIIAKETASLSRNKWGNPFDEVAESLFKRQLRIQEKGLDV